MNHFQELFWKRFQTKGRVLSLVAVAIVALFIGCNSTDRPAYPAADTADQGAGGALGATDLTGSCSPGTKRECSITLKQHEGIITCFRGTSLCGDEGTWGTCAEGTTTDEVDPSPLHSPSSKRLLALSSATAATCNEVCDPGCMLFTETTPTLSGTASGGGSATGCTHDTCTVSASPLSTTCGACVTKVCAKSAYCCQTSWDSGCVNLAYSECASSTPPLGLCDFGVFGKTSVTTSNRPSTGASIGSVGDITVGTDATPGSIVTKGNLIISAPNGKKITTPGGVWVVGNVTAQNGAGAQYIGDWHVGGSIDLTGGNSIVGNVYAHVNIANVAITGNAYAGGTIAASVTATGTKTSGSPQPIPVINIPATVPTRTVSCTGTTDYTINAGQTQTLAPGNYRNVTLQNGTMASPSVLVLTPGGSYTFKTLSITSGCQYCRIRLGTPAAPTGTWNVSVCGQALLEGPFSYIADPTDTVATRKVLTTPEELVLYVDATDPGVGQYAAKIGNDFKFVGVLMVPNGTFRSEDRGSVNGAVWAKAISSGTDLAATQISKAACEALAIPGTTPAPTTCPITTTVTPPIAVGEYEYQASCPAATTARWKNLTWVSTVPGTSSITFRAKVASSLANLAAASYTLVGTSKLGPPNTTTCSLSGPSPACPVALTNQLALGANQGQFLSLHVEIDSSGGATTLSNWKASYTCQYDE